VPAGPATVQPGPLTTPSAQRRRRGAREPRGPPKQSRERFHLLGIPGLYVTGDPGAVDEAAKVGSLSIRIGLGWAKSHSFTTGQCPVMRYHYGLMQMILGNKAQIAKAVNATVISLDEAPQGYEDFDKGAAKKFVFNPHGLIKA